MTNGKAHQTQPGTTTRKKRGKKKQRPPKKRGWSQEEDDTLRKLWPTSPDKVIMAALGRSQTNLYARAKQLGIERSPEYTALHKARAAHRIRTDPVMSRQIFQPGLVPWNTGKTGYQPGGRSAETRFKPGSKPHTTLPVGAHRILHSNNGGPVLERKISDAPGPHHKSKHWVPVARLVWEEAHGPIPPGYIVVFKTPGLRTVELEQITLDKLDCITRAEHAKRNHPRNKHPELGRLIQLKGAITRQVNRIAREQADRATATNHNQQPAAQQQLHETHHTKPTSRRHSRAPHQRPARPPAGHAG